MTAVQTQWARLLVESLAAAGAGPFVVSPGSRSTPLAAAVAAAGLPLHVVVDERSAGFFALGCARVTGRPAVLVCTSGSAGAHYLPAIIEAAYASVPLVAVTADRPPELQDCAAPQTIDQPRMFGHYVRHAAELGLPDPAPGALRALRRRAARAVSAALGPAPGPVHLNAPARKPLEPCAPANDAERAVAAEVDRLLARPFTSAPARLALDRATVSAVADACRATPRGLIVAGPGPLGQGAEVDAVLRLAEVTGYPVLAEAASQLRFVAAGDRGRALRCDGYELFLGDEGWRRDLAPALVLQLGAPPTSAAVARLLEEAAPARWVVTAGPWSDPSSDAAGLIFGPVGATAAALAEALAGDPGPEDAAWRAAWREADARARAAVESGLEARADAAPMREGAAVRAALAAAPAGALVLLGNSLPIRLVDALCPSGLARVGVLSQRGANGIDGLVSAAAGSAATSGRPLVALVGDVTFLHDVGGLAAARAVTTPLVIVVIDNGGGRIFEQLPIGAAEVPFERLWLTPPALDVEGVARGFGVAAERVADAPALGAAVRRASARPGCTVVRAMVAPTSAAEDLRALRAIVSRSTTA